MKFIVPTQSAPQNESLIGGIEISPMGRIKVEYPSMTMYWDSMIVDSSVDDWNYINDWMMFHCFIFNETVSLDWYEGPYFDLEGERLIKEGECNSLVDYHNISEKVYASSTCPKNLEYSVLFNTFLRITPEHKRLIKNFFNSQTPGRGAVAINRKIRDNSFWQIIVLYSIIENLIGASPECSEVIACKRHGKIHHNEFDAKEWIKMRLTEIIDNPTIVEEYFKVIWKVRQGIRHKTVHASAIPESKSLEQDIGEIIWDWDRVSMSWEEDSIALLALSHSMRYITRILLLNRAFGLDFFPVPKPLMSTRTVFVGGESK